MVSFVPGFTSQALIDWNRTPADRRRGTAPRATLAQVVRFYNTLDVLASLKNGQNTQDQTRFLLTQVIHAVAR